MKLLSEVTCGASYSLSSEESDKTGEQVQSTSLLALKLMGRIGFYCSIPAPPKGIEWLPGVTRIQVAITR